MRIFSYRTLALSLFIAGFSGPALAHASGDNTANPGANPAPRTATLPDALRPALYQALAKDAGVGYNLDSRGCATLPKQPLKACFDSSGAHFRGIAKPLSLHLIAYGRGNDLAPVASVRPEITGNRVNYAHGNLSEWWQVLPVGFEQGFTIAKQPHGHGELTLILVTSGQDAGAPGESGDRFRQGTSLDRHFPQSGNPAKNTLAWGKLRYGELVVTDANGKMVPATLKTMGDRVLIAVNDTHAAYPLTVDPLVWLEQKVFASDGAMIEQFGFSVSLGGTTAFVGTPQATVNGNQDQGAVYVFSESNGIWTQMQKLSASDGAEFDSFGTSVSLDGTTAVVGAPDATANGNLYEGAAYVFTESGGTWTQAQRLTSIDGASFDFFGHSVALEGSTALVGADDAAVGDNAAQGAVYVFDESDGSWSQTQKLTASDGATGDIFGYSIALDGPTALVGAYAANGYQGAAYVFDNSGGAWSQTAKLIASDGAANDYFGYSVALDGPSALVGAWGTPVNGNDTQGAAYVFTESNGTWSQTQELTASDGAAFDQFGYTAALNGAIALVGAAGVNGSQGAVYRFDESNGTWTQVQKLMASDGAAYDEFGSALSFRGTTALVGAWGVTINGNGGQGAAYFYGESDLSLNVSAPQTVGQGQSYVSQAIATNEASAASPAVAVTVTVPAAASFVSASATQGSCSEDSGVVTCDFGQINGNAGTATANVTLKATGNVGDTIDNTATVANATPPLSANAATTITAGGACPAGYTEYDGNLNPGEVARSPVYQAPGGEQNAILTAPGRFQLYAVYQSGRYGRHIYLVPGNEVHRWGPKGLYMWLVRARDGAGACTLCLQHP